MEAIIDNFFNDVENNFNINIFLNYFISLFIKGEGLQELNCNYSEISFMEDIKA